MDAVGLRMIDLGGGLRLRTAVAADLPQVEALLTERGEPADAVDLRLVVEDPDQGLDSCAVVVDGNRVVSTATLLDEMLVVDGVPVPAGQVELVATDRAYEGRGLVRALMRWAHERSAGRGHLVQLMIGIPYFYRQFGYAYSIPMQQWRPLASRPAADPSVTVRPATAADIPAMGRLEAGAQAGATLQLERSEGCWRWLATRTGSEQWVAEHEGVVTAVGRALPPEEGAMLGELAADDAASALALVAHLSAQRPGLEVQERPGTTAGDAVAPFLGPALAARPDWYYTRVERLGPLLAALGPVLARRLAGAGMDGDHDLLVSTYREHVRCTVGPGGVRDVTEGGPLQGPVSQGGSGVPPDGVGPLLFGPQGALGLEQRMPDCNLGRQRDLMAVLFPPVTADLLTFYLPT
jgi:predicted N-acetyltransferase YhbS